MMSTAPYLLPANFTPAASVLLGSNVLQDVPVLMEVNGVPLLLIGRGGPAPLIWLSAPTGPGTKERQYIVEESVSRAPAVTVTQDKAGKRTTIRIGQTYLLRARHTKDGQTVVDHLDMRPLGLNITADNNSMKVGHATLAKNTILGSRVGISFSQAPRPAADVPQQG